MRYLNYICHKSIKSDSWESGKISVVGTPSNLGLILEDITNMAEVQIVSINNRLLPTWDTCKIHGTIILPYRGFAIIGG